MRGNTTSEVMDSMLFDTSQAMPAHHALSDSDLICLWTGAGLKLYRNEAAMPKCDQDLQVVPRFPIEYTAHMHKAEV